MRSGRGKNTKSRRRGSPVTPTDLLTPESAARLREQGLLSRVVRLPYLPLETTATPGLAQMSASAPVSTPVPTPTPAPAPLSTSARQPAPSIPSPAPRPAAPTPAAAPQPVDDLDTTLLRPRHLDLELPDGSRVQIGGRPIVIGRRPTGATGDELVAIDDPTRSISRRHFRVMARPDGSVWAEDLDSGNGTLVERGGESVSALVPAVPVKIVSRDVLVLGEHRVRVVRRPPGPLPQT